MPEEGAGNTWMEEALGLLGSSSSSSKGPGRQLPGHPQSQSQRDRSSGDHPPATRNTTQREETADPAGGGRYRVRAGAGGSRSLPTATKAKRRRPNEGNTATAQLLNSAPAPERRGWEAGDLSHLAEGLHTTREGQSVPQPDGILRQNGTERGTSWGQRAVPLQPHPSQPCCGESPSEKADLVGKMSSQHSPDHSVPLLHLPIFHTSTAPTAVTVPVLRQPTPSPTPSPHVPCGGWQGAGPGTPRQGGRVG